MSNQIEKPRIYADFNGQYDPGMVLLTCHGTFRDLERFGIVLSEGLEVVLYMDDEDTQGNEDDLEVDAVVRFRSDLACWVGYFDRNTFRHASDRPSLP